MVNARRRARAAAETVLTSGEQILDCGLVWATRRREGVPLLFLARRRYLATVTDRRMLVFERRGSGPRRTPTPAHLVLGKRLDSFTLERKRSRPFLIQLRVVGTNMGDLVLEFHRNQRTFIRALTDRVPSGSSVPPVPLAAAIGSDSTVAPAAPAPTAAEVTSSDAEAFWGPR